MPGQLSNLEIKLNTILERTEAISFFLFPQAYGRTIEEMGCSMTHVTKHVVAGETTGVTSLIPVRPVACGLVFYSQVACGVAVLIDLFER